MVLICLPFEELGEKLKAMPIHVMAMFSENEPDNSLIKGIAEKFSKDFNCTVHLGFIEHVHGDEFEYKATSQIRS